jgi:hypothetical protein
VLHGCSRRLLFLLLLLLLLLARCLSSVLVWDVALNQGLLGGCGLQRCHSARSLPPSRAATLACLALAAAAAAAAARASGAAVPGRLLLLCIVQHQCLAEGFGGANARLDGIQLGTAQHTAACQGDP